MIRRSPAKILAAAAVLLLTRAASALDLPELAARSKPSVVLLTMLDASGEVNGTGTGFFVSADGRLVTNHHVVEGASKVVATLDDGTKKDVAGVLADDPASDIAVLKVDGDAFPTLPLGDSRTLKPGDEVAVIGSPRGLSGTLSAGIVSAIRERGPTSEAIRDEKVQSWGVQITAAVSPGSSGSPIMTRGGEVVAVAVGQLGNGQALNFGVPIEITKAMLANLGPNAQVTPFSRASNGEVRRNLIISAAVFAAVALAYLAWSRYESRRRAHRPRPLH